MRRQASYAIGMVVLAVAGLVYTFAAGNEPLLGLDLQGGASVVLEPEPNPDGSAVAGGLQVWVQLKSVFVTIVYTGGVSFALLKLVDLTIGLKATEHEERVGLDLTEHAEVAYTLVD